MLIQNTSIEQLEDTNFTKHNSSKTVFDCEISSVLDFEDDFEELSTINSTSNFDTTDDTMSTSDEVNNLLGFRRFNPPPLLTRHPPPAVGRDDDIRKLKEILDDMLVKLGHPDTDTNNTGNRILFAPDNKIATNLFKLMDNNPKYRVFLPEFPLLHLKKSKITTLSSAYKDAGLLKLLKYMTDHDKDDDWSKLLTPANIEAATRNIKRLTVALQLAFIIAFLDHLPPGDAESLLTDLQSADTAYLVNKWDERYQLFLQKGIQQNATFTLHHEMLSHCREVIAISCSERLGGPDGYQLLLASVKSSLPLAFLNGASSYAAFCTRLLYEHYSAGPFHKNFKETFYTTPHKDSTVNFGLDTQREMDHRDALKCFRPRATVSAVLPRMSLVDTFAEIHEKRSLFISSGEHGEQGTRATESWGWGITKTDMEHILPLISVIVRKKALTLTSDNTPKNAYSTKKKILPQSFLDKETSAAGQYLIRKYAHSQGLFGLSSVNCPTLDGTEAPKPLLDRIRRGKSVTIKRTSIKIQEERTEREMKEEKRKRLTNRKKKEVECLTSEMNMCQAVVKPDCSKPKVAKSKSIQNATIDMLASIYQATETEPLDKSTESASLKLDENNVVKLSQKTLPHEITEHIKFATLEFAGVKFKTRAVSGDEYLKQVESNVIGGITKLLPALKHLVVSEEKYRFTPDNFKAATRAQRTKKTKASIAHLRTSQEMMSKATFNKESLVSTSEGKVLISKYLAQNVESLCIKRDILLDIDSELILSGCDCEDRDTCTCNVSSSPIRAVFSLTQGFKEKMTLHDIRQRKGEAEMAQVDWLMETLLPLLTDGDAVASVLSSGDIDAIPIHLFVLSYKWPRDATGSFLYPVHVILQKPGGTFDFYCITDILQMIENHFHDRQIGMKVALCLCLGGKQYTVHRHWITGNWTTVMCSSIPCEYQRESTRTICKVHQCAVLHVGCLQLQLLLSLQSLSIAKLNICSLLDNTMQIYLTFFKEDVSRKQVLVK